MGLSFDSVFGSQMLLQRDRPITLTGTASPGTRVAVAIDAESGEAVADTNGRWSAEFAPRPAGGPCRVTAKSDGKSIALDDVLFGDVWICAGQSNMLWPLRACKDGKAETARADFDRIRLFQVQQNTAPYGPVDDVGGKWRVCSPENAADFSGVAYFFGRQLWCDLGVPIGLVHASWGGVRINTWIPEAGFTEAGLPEAGEIAMLRQYRDRPEQNPRLLEASARLGGWVEKFERQMRTSTDVDCSKFEYDDRDWPIADRKSLPIPGSGWFRLAFDLPENWVGRKLHLCPGRINDCDRTFFNGVPVGATDWRTTGHWFKVRDYTVLANVVKPGKNVVAIHVFNYNLAGGLTDLGGNMYIATEEAPEERISLADNWRARQEFAADMQSLGPRPPLPEDLSGDSPDFPSSLFNAMLSPWTKLKVRGAIWYQGCSNAGKPGYYAAHQALIKAWRHAWGDENMPFIITQLAGLGKNSPADQLPEDFWVDLPPENEPPFALIREIQAEMASRFNRVGLAVAMDAGATSDIHPTDKRIVGVRLAKEAERIAYDQDNGSPGPVFRDFTVSGNTISVRFFHAESGLATCDGRAPGAFAVAGADMKFHWAQAAISPAKDRVTVFAPEVRAPRAVRYAFASYRGDVNLCSQAGFPARPFRSDRPEFESEPTVL